MRSSFYRKVRISQKAKKYELFGVLAEIVYLCRLVIIHRQYNGGFFLIHGTRSVRTTEQ